jgi:hypothetical protein
MLPPNRQQPPPPPPCGGWPQIGPLNINLFAARFNKVQQVPRAAGEVVVAVGPIYK